MKKIQAKEIKKIALLANIRLSNENAEKLVPSVTGVIVHMEALKSLQLDEVSETTQITEDISRGREDFVTPSLPQKEALKNGMVYKGYFIVNQVLHRKDK